MKNNQNEAFNERDKIRRLENTEKIESFDCGDEALNDFILNQFSFFGLEKLAVCYALENRKSQDVLAFFSLTNDKIATTDFDNKTLYNRFSRRFSNRKRLKSYPAVKIGRLGVSNLMQGQNIGTFIINFIKTYFINNNKSGCRFLTVDAYYEAIPFYQKNGFIPLNEADAHDKTRLLYFDLNDVSD